MEKHEICIRMRRNYSAIGWILLLYYGILNIAVMIAALLDAPRGGIDPNNLMLNGWGYLVASCIGFLLLVFYKSPNYAFRDLWKPVKPLCFSRLWMILCLFISTQALFQGIVWLFETILSGYDIFVLEEMVTVSSAKDSLSMMLYAGIAAPIVEELLFRGFVLRTLLPYGKSFAIAASALLFGIFHGHILQSPFAFAVGLVLGYVTVEYSISWAMILHLINNLIFGVGFALLDTLLPLSLLDAIFSIIIYGCALGAAIILIYKMKSVLRYWFQGDKHPFAVRCFFSSPGILVFLAIMLVSVLLSVFTA